MPLWSRSGAGRLLALVGLAWATVAAGVVAAGVEADAAKRTSAMRGEAEAAVQAAALEGMRRALDGMGDGSGDEEVGEYDVGGGGGGGGGGGDGDGDGDGDEYESFPPSPDARPPTYPDWRFHFPTPSPTPNRPHKPSRQPGGGGGGSGDKSKDKWTRKSNAAGCRSFKRRNSCCEDLFPWSGCDNRDVPSGCVWHRRKCVPMLPGEESPAAACMNRTTGAIMQFRFLDQDYSFWSTNDAFISEAISLRRRGSTRIPVFVLRRGRDCDERGMHPDPNLMAFVDFSAAVCAYSPNAVAVDVDSFINSTSQSLWCPWGAYDWRVWPLKP